MYPLLDAVVLDFDPSQADNSCGFALCSPHFRTLHFRAPTPAAKRLWVRRLNTVIRVCHWSRIMSRTLSRRRWLVGAPR